MVRREKNRTKPIARAIVSITLSLLFASAVGCDGKQDAIGAKSTDDPFATPTDEHYGQGIDDSKDTDPPPPPKENITPASEELRARTTVDLNFVDSGVTKPCHFDDYNFALHRFPDNSVALFVSFFGILETGTNSDSNNWTTYCGVNFVVPWEPESPPNLPYTWVYANSQQYGPTDAIIQSWKDSWASVYTYTLSTDGNPEPEIDIIFPNPNWTDPHWTEMTGETVIETATNVGWYTDMEVIGHGHFHGTDHVGMTIEGSYSVAPAANK